MAQQNEQGKSTQDKVRKIVKAGHKVFVEKGLGQGIFRAFRK